MGKKMLDFRRSLPAYKEKNALLTSISHNQVHKIFVILARFDKHCRC